MQAAQWRALTLADCSEWAALLNEVERQDDAGEHYDAADLAEELSDPKQDSARNTIGIWAGPELVAYGAVQGASAVLDGEYRVRLMGAVAPKHRRVGFGGRLLDWLLARGAALHTERHPQAAGLAEVRALAGNAGQRALLERAGFSPVRWFFDMQRALAEIPPVRVPAGLRLVPFQLAHSEATRLAHNEAFADHWGFTPTSVEDWRRWGIGQRAFRPGVSFLLLDGTEVAGYLLSYEYEAERAATGVREAHVGVLGTRRPWRGRGAGRALLAQAVRAYAEQGYHRAALGVDATNPTGALGLYESLGFAIRRQSISYARPLLPG